LATSGTPDVIVNDTTTSGQTWEGFGGCFSELGWSYLTSTAMQAEAMQLLFGTDGANFDWGRIPIGASSYAISRYTHDDTTTPNDPVPSGETNRPPADSSLLTFNIDRDREKLIPYIHAAQTVKPSLRFWASPWTPPSWMKTGYKTTSDADSSKAAPRPSFFDGGSFSNSAQRMNSYAEYYKKWVQAYDAEGIKIDYVSPQNEPSYEFNNPTCLWDAATYVNWVKILGPAMGALNVKVMLGTLSNDGDYGRTDLDIAAAVLADSTAKNAISVVGVQWSVLDKVNAGTATFQGLPIWATEHRGGNYPWATSTYNATQAPNDQAYGVESWGYIRDAITKGKVTAYNAWNMVLNKVGRGMNTTRLWNQNALL
jgi:glucosylceramidase